MIEFVAWVPDDDPKREWEVAAKLAAAWVEDRSRAEGAAAVLVTNALERLGVPALDDFARRHAHTSPRAGRGRVSPGSGPVLSYVPYADQLDFAMGLARGSSLAVVETVTFPLPGWASWLGAWDLVRDKQTAPLADDLREAVARLKFYGNNGFGDSFGKQQAKSILRELGTRHRDMWSTLPGAVLAAGVSARGVARLQHLMET
jgi:hypothetical protein